MLICAAIIPVALACSYFALKMQFAIVRWLGWVQ
jgi:hypothetical protein